VTIFFISSRVALDLSLFTLLDTTMRLSTKYPLVESILSKLIELSSARCLWKCRGMLRTGQVMGMPMVSISLGVSSKGIPLFFALALSWFQRDLKSFLESDVVMGGRHRRMGQRESILSRYT